MTRIEKRLLILWFALAFVVWNGVYDMRMHDTVRGYLLEATRAEAGLGRGVDMRTFLARHRVDAIAFSSAWAFGVFLAGMATMYTYRRYLTNRTQHPGTQHPGTQRPGTQHPGTQRPGTQHPGTQHPRHPAPRHPAPRHPAPRHPAPTHPAPITQHPAPSTPSRCTP